MTELYFENALRKGLGRCAVVLEKQDGAVLYKKKLLECCLKSISSFTQIENSRGEYLYTLVKKINDDQYFLQPIITEYKKEKAKDLLYDGKLEQMTDFLWCFSKENNVDAYDALTKKFADTCIALYEKNEEEYKKAFIKISLSFIKNEGFGGYIRSIRMVDNICIANKFYSFEDFEEVLHAGIYKYQRKRILKEVSLYAGRKIYNYFYILFRKANEKEEKETAKRPVILNFKSSDIEETYCLINNIKEQGIENTIYNNDMHMYNLCKKIISLHEIKLNRRVPKELLLFVYENSPCYTLRARAIHFMGKKKMITKEIAKESLNDCDPYIRNYIKQYHKDKLC